MDKLQLINDVIKKVQPVGDIDIKVTSLDQNFTDIGLDSLGVIMLMVYLGEIYGVPEDVVKSFQFENFEQLFEAFEKTATKHYNSAAEALAAIGY